MRKFVFASVILALASAPAAAETLATELQPLAFLAGSCWRGPAPGNQAIDTHCFSTILGGHFLRDRHRLDRGGYAGETLYRWDASARQIRWDYYASDGMLMSGTAAGTGLGLAFAVSSVSPANAAPASMRVGWRRDGADVYFVTTEVQENGAWRVLGPPLRFERAGPAPVE